MASIHYSSRPIPKFVGDEPVLSTDTVDHISAYLFPDRILKVRLDTSAKAKVYPIVEMSDGKAHLVFDWEAAFDEELISRH